MFHYVLFILPFTAMFVNLSFTLLLRLKHDRRIGVIMDILLI